MQSKNHETTILNIELIELYRTVKNVCSLLQRSPLYIIYISANESFAIRIQDFTQNLSKDLAVQALIPKNDDNYPSYILQHEGGDYTIRIVKIASPEALSTLETLFHNHCFLYYESEDKPVEDDQKMRQVRTRHAQNPKQGLLARLISFGGEISKTGMIKSAEILGNGITRAGEFVQNRYIKNPEKKEVSDMMMYKLKAANLATNMTVHATAIPAQGIAYAGKQITKKVGDKILSSEFGNKHHESIVEVGNSSLYAAACFYDGFTEALSIFGSKVADTTTKIITQKYGDKAGEATKEGMNVIGNIGKVVNVFKEDAVRIIEESSSKT